MTRQPTPESVEKAREIEGPCRYGQHPSCLSPTCGPCIRTLRCALALDAERAAGRAEGRAEGMEEAAKVCERRREARFEEHGYTEPDTNASYYTGPSAEQYEARDEEDDDCARAIRARAKDAAK